MNHCMFDFYVRVRVLNGIADAEPCRIAPVRR
jgi:hypothetical protein